MHGQRMAAALAVVMAATAVNPMITHASAGFDLRKKVVGLSGIMNTGNINMKVTRGEFAGMLVNASSYRSTVGSTSNTSVFADVPRDHEYASSIRIASEQGFMNGYLGGNFKPEEYITLQEAVKGVLGLLEYKNSDFTGDQTGSRMSKYHFLELDDGLNKEASELMTKEDCVNLFYNLLKTDTKSGTMFGKSLDCELTSDGEINPFSMVDNSVKGPRVVNSKSRLKSYLPFDLSDANIYLDGDPVKNSSDAITTAFDSTDGVLVYYHTLSKTVWLYTVGNENESGRSAVLGEITNVVYNSTDLMTPTAIILDDGNTYVLTSTEMQFAFSSYGDLRVGDSVNLVYTLSEDAEGNQTRTVVDYIED
ncbi:S-layer homology domain-containing protein [Lacrimispora aerotolerans]|uniref:S-layer homology domain-containing protein n=1 Tax=Lacrimispora aerotolerans TaxID=36832 RepID=UPI00047B53D1|nr:S-layer homology domain-containing protein [Lacrimispora aerotolerans]